ncbi:MAG: dienelactone hydrolase family protein [Oscillatoriales cyanobacterium]|nr:MAG: dienelactone hydrolase family protein [Oscillatoriales cyanobacterium]
MPNPEIRTANVTVPNGDLQIATYLAQPAAAGQFPAVIVIQEIFGVNSHIRDVTERIAKEGYVAIAPAIYQRQAPGFETGYAPEDIKIGRQYKEQTTASQLLSDIQAAIDYLKTLPEIKATASFYGAGIATLTPGGGTPTIARTADIQGTLYGFYGTQDASIPKEQVDQIAAELQKHRIPHRIFRYNADHGFFCDHRGSYNATAAAESWVQVKQLFQQELQPA